MKPVEGEGRKQDRQRNKLKNLHRGPSQAHRELWSGKALQGGSELGWPPRPAWASLVRWGLLWKEVWPSFNKAVFFCRGWAEGCLLVTLAVWGIRSFISEGKWVARHCSLLCISIIFMIYVNDFDFLSFIQGALYLSSMYLCIYLCFSVTIYLSFYVSYLFIYVSTCLPTYLHIYHLADLPGWFEIGVLNIPGLKRAFMCMSPVISHTFCSVKAVAKSS